MKISNLQSQLAEALQVISEGENIIEGLRQQLCKHNEFQIHAAFYALDRLQTSKISGWDIQNFLNNYQIACSEEDASMLIRQYDYDSDTMLNLTEFQCFCLPAVDLQLKEVTLLRQQRNTLHYQAKELLAHLFDQEIQFQRKWEAAKQQIYLDTEFSIDQIFALLDQPATGFITKEKLTDFLAQSGFPGLSTEIDAILRRLDLDDDDRLSYWEILTNFIPFNASYDPPASPTKSPRPSSPLKRESYQDSVLIDNGNLKLRVSYSKERKSETRFSSFGDIQVENQRRNESPIRNPFKDQSPTKTQYVDALKQQIEIYRHLEEAKTQLTYQADFNLQRAFRYFDIELQGYINRRAFHQGLMNLGLSPLDDDLDLLMNRYSRFKDQKIRFTEFAYLFMPKSESLASSLKTSASDSQPNFSQKTLDQLYEVLKLLLSNESVAESVRQKLQDQDLDYYNLFKELDKSNNLFLTFAEFKEVLNSNGIYASQADLKNIVEQYDHDGDGRVNLTDFIEELRTKSPSKYY